MAKQEITCDDILRELKAGQYRPIYYLMGEEPYYIDLISDYITDNVLNETEKEFNLTVVYGADVDVAAIINAAKQARIHDFIMTLPEQYQIRFLHHILPS